MTDEVSQRLGKAARLLGQIGGLDPAAQGEMLVHHAYYAMFHAASAVVLAKTGAVPIRHSTVVSEFGRLMRDLGEDGRRHGRALNRAHDVRLVADYAIDTRVLPATARETARLPRPSSAFAGRSWRAADRAARGQHLSPQLNPSFS